MSDIEKRNGYHFFWSGWPSNWEPSPFKIEGIRYSCVEQYMMAEKARLFGDNKTLKKIMEAKHPREQKSLGRKVDAYDDHKWASVRYQVVLRATIEKYRQNKHLLDLLLATDGIFVEASPYDKVWGIGMESSDKGVENSKNWQGQNLLGKAITEAREILRSSGE